jgi:hypothetical protein
MTSTAGPPRRIVLDSNGAPSSVWLVNELPKRPTGKILKREIEAPVASAEAPSPGGPVGVLTAPHRSAEER